MSANIDPNARYSASHEWARTEGDLIVVGISDFAQHELSDVVYVELPVVGDSLTKGEVLGTSESVKAAGELYAPVSGEVVAVNTELIDHPDWVNQDPYGKGWMVKLSPSNPAELTELMDAAAYQATLP